MKPKTEKDRGRLSTTDESGGRIKIYPADYRGFWKNRRSIVQILLLAIFLTLPWIRINGHPAILLNIAERRFSVLGFPFWGHDAPIFFFVLAGFVFSIFFVTAVWGRAWCGWACPQTVFVDGVFRRVERWIEGDAFTRRKRDSDPQARKTADYWVRKLAKGAAFLALALIMSHSFLGYFVGTERLLEMVRSNPSEHPEAFAVMFAMTALVLFDFGWFREQFCTIMCPYGRFQSVLLSDRSMVVAYDVARGEPRKGTAKSKKGDCVDCKRCIQVCPTGIDIRNGLQMECLACTACMDACDEVMRRIHKPTKLISYSPFQLGGRASAYMGALLVLVTGFSAVLSTRKPLDTTLIRAIESPYQILSETEVSNHFRIELYNRGFEPQKIQLTSSDPRIQLVMANPIGVLNAGESRHSDLFIRFSKSLLSLGSAQAQLKIEGISEATGKPESSEQQEVHLVGPYR